MCYLKAFKSLDQIADERDTSTDESSCQEIPMNFPFNGCPILQPYSFKAPPVTRQEQLLAELMGCVRANNFRLSYLHQKLSQNEQHLLNSQLELEDLTIPRGIPSPTTKTPELDLPEKTCLQQNSDSHPLLTKLFGAKDYEYRLELQGEVSSTIFKERNINIPLALVDRKGQKVLNSNIIHLCLGVCDAKGEWVAQNRNGEDFMKGKTEVEMYHGEGAFLKVYARDISRHYPEGKINFVVYSKPSLLQFSNSISSIEKIVESSQIKPFLIPDILIKAKKS